LNKFNASREPTAPNASVSGEGACSRELCELTFPFTNNPLGLLAGVRKISFGVNISVQAGRVTSVAVAYQRMADRVRDMPEEPLYLYGVLNDAVRKDSEYGPKKENLDSSGVRRLLLYRLGPHSTPADKTKAFALDLSCLDSFTGCSGPSAICPPAGNPGKSTDQRWCNAGRKVSKSFAFNPRRSESTFIIDCQGIRRL
jgi:hypothetical protein